LVKARKELPLALLEGDGWKSRISLQDLRVLCCHLEKVQELRARVCELELERTEGR
jgi:hypothetical protein